MGCWSRPLILGAVVAMHPARLAHPHLMPSLTAPGALEHPSGEPLPPGLQGVAQAEVDAELRVDPRPRDERATPPVHTEGSGSSRSRRRPSHVFVERRSTWPRWPHDPRCPRGRGGSWQDSRPRFMTIPSPALNIPSRALKWDLSIEPIRAAPSCLLKSGLNDRSILIRIRLPLEKPTSRRPFSAVRQVRLESCQPPCTVAWRTPTMPRGVRVKARGWCSSAADSSRFREADGWGKLGPAAASWSPRAGPARRI